MSPELAQIIYDDTMRDLKSRIEAKSGSFRKFCSEQNPKINNCVLSRAFSDNHPKEMSVGMFYRVCVGLGDLDPHRVHPDHYRLDMSLKDYFMATDNPVFTAVLAIRFDYEGGEMSNLQKERCSA
jgi:hypothetical protein